jgi:hypothetical protein
MQLLAEEAKAPKHPPETKGAGAHRSEAHTRFMALHLDDVSLMPYKMLGLHAK